MGEFLAMAVVWLFVCWVLKVIAEAEPFVTEDEKKAIKKWLDKR